MQVVLREIVPGVVQIGLGFVDAFFVEGEAGLTLIDAGTLGSAPSILEAVRAVGHRPRDLARILVTHCHADHYGGLAELKRQCPADVYAHPADAREIERGRTGPPLTHSPIRPLQPLLRMASARWQVEACRVEHELSDGEVLPDGVQVVPTPGHTYGHVAFFYPRHGGVLFAGDACSNVLRLGMSIGYADPEEGRASSRRLSELDFEVAVFGHGGPIRAGASRRFRDRFDQPAAAFP